MNSGKLFTQALGLLPPWYVERIEFKTDSKGSIIKNRNTLNRKLIETYPALATSVRLQELFDDFFEFSDQEKAAAFLANWCDLAEESKILPMMKLAATIKSHWSGIINYVQAKIYKGILESTNSKIQLAKRRARGYRNKPNLINMIYFIAGESEFDYPHYST